MLQKSEIPSEKFMSEYALNEASELLRSVAGNRAADESLKAVLRRLQRRLSGGWSANRIRAVWYRDDRVRVRAEELEELRALAATKDKPKAKELAELRETIERLSKYEALLERLDSDFHSQEIAAARFQIRQARSLV